MNLTLFLAINNFRSPALDLFMTLGTALGNFSNIVWLVGLICAAYLATYVPQWRQHAHHRPWLADLLPTLLIGFIVTAVLVASLKYGMHEPRPGALFGPQVIHAGQIEDSPYSFPSGHSAFAMLVAATLWRRTSGPICLIFPLYALWVGFSRINLGMHFPLDVICGWAIGALGAWTAHNAMRQIREQPWWPVKAPQEEVE